MSYFLSASRLSGRLSTRVLRQDMIFRELRTSTASLVAQNLTMPALSPTMTEGNISKWNLKEGDIFSAGDVLLEIETDKASMDVEAQEDGVLAKVVHGEGSKGIKVGTRIGVLADVGDDISTLDFSFKETITTNSTETKSSATIVEKSQQKSTSSLSKEKNTTQPNKAANYSSKKQLHTFLPSVQHLIRLHSLDQSTIESIKPSGPNNRLLKGDLLAFLGQVPGTYPSQLSSKISILSHLDLSNVKIRKNLAKPAISKAVNTENVQPEVMVNLEQSISLKNVHEVQEKLKNILGVTLSEDDFITRATVAANESLRSKSYKATPDQLFDSILGLTNDLTSRRADNYHFRPLKAGSSTMPPVLSPTASSNYDIIDILCGKKPPTPKLVPSEKDDIGLRIFKLKVTKDEEQRAKIFFDNMKINLECKPGSLVL